MISLYMHFMAKSFLAFYINILKNSFSLPPRRLAIKHTFTSKLNSKDRHITRRQTSCRRGQGDSNWMFKLANTRFFFLSKFNFLLSIKSINKLNPPKQETCSYTLRHHIGRLFQYWHYNANNSDTPRGLVDTAVFTWIAHLKTANHCALVSFHTPEHNPKHEVQFLFSIYLLFSSILLMTKNY